MANLCIQTIARGDFRLMSLDNEQEIAAPWMIDSEVIPAGTVVTVRTNIVVANNGSSVSVHFRLRHGGTETAGTGTLIATSATISTNGTVTFEGELTVEEGLQFLKLSAFKAPLTAPNEQIYNTTLLFWEEEVLVPKRRRPVTNQSQDELGVDIACITDIDNQLTVVSGFRNLAMALARRLSTPRGALFYDPDYGLDLRSFLNMATTEAEVASLGKQVQLEVEKDPRVASADVAVAFSRATMSMKVTIQVTTAVGPFRLVMAVDQVSVAVLNAA